jgi:hypothetical protein
MSLLGFLDSKASRARAKAILRYRQLVSRHEGVTDAEGAEFAELAEHLGKTRSQIQADCAAASEIRKLRQLCSEYDARDKARELAVQRFNDRHELILEEIKKLNAENAKLYYEMEAAQEQFQQSNVARGKLPAILQANPDAAEAEKPATAASA